MPGLLLCKESRFYVIHGKFSAALGLPVAVNTDPLFFTENLRSDSTQGTMRMIAPGMILPREGAPYRFRRAQRGVGSGVFAKPDTRATLFYGFTSQ